MNPSSSGWISKFFSINKTEFPEKENSLLTHYHALKSCGFIYGTSVHCVYNRFENLKLTSEEITKINLLSALVNSFFDKFPNGDEKKFVELCITFYENYKEEKFNIFKDLFSGKKSASQLEKIIANRIQFDSNIITKNFSNILTNTLLFIDVLAFQNFLKDEKQNSIAYTKNLETVVETVVIASIKTKEEKSKYDKQLLKLFEASLRYHEEEQSIEKTYQEHIQFLKTELEKQYLLDITCMTVWDDKNLELAEIDYIKKLAVDLDVANETVNEAILKVYDFFDAHKEELPYLSDPNPVKNFYDNSSQMVMNLITRNSKRLLLELSQSKELVILLSQSTARDLNKGEKQKVKEQLLDICKSIPSLAIFILPGGSVLLPLLIKFIPKLLPSAFDDNRIR
ncbi:LETM1-like protein [Pustulibacterium marinum]|uniref:LETM1-like protein n=2 Tax=Pustulibacterium marinum TaxID=1224947 RepID=A0A1I7HWG5_9FLAO|nr:LETM1-like protein [Pustulibacterium marinum]